jgi:hypothetical protein
MARQVIIAYSVAHGFVPATIEFPRRCSSRDEEIGTSGSPTGSRSSLNGVRACVCGHSSKRNPRVCVPACVYVRPGRRGIIHLHTAAAPGHSNSRRFAITNVGAPCDAIGFVQRRRYSIIIGQDGGLRVY